MFDNPFDRGLPEPPLPPGGIRVGNQVRYPDLQGDLHSTPGDAIDANRRLESDYSRGASGGCGQDPSRIPDPRNGG